MLLSKWTKPPPEWPTISCRWTTLPDVAFWALRSFQRFTLHYKAAGLLICIYQVGQKWPVQH